MDTRIVIVLTLAVLFPTAAAQAQDADYTVYLIPNTHGTIGGWLVNFDTERSYILNNHLDHLDRIAADPTYKLAISEVPNVMALLKFAPERVDEIRRLAREGRIGFVNGFFLEPTVNLSGGEALAQMATLGLRWYEEVLGLRPRFAWMIDVCGMHGQMPQIVAESGLEALFFSRNNPMPKDAFWWVAPDGSKTFAVALGPGYAAARTMYQTAEPLSDAQMEELATAFAKGHQFAASPRHLLMGAGGGDYSLAPKRRTYPREFLEAWRRRFPKVAVQMAVPTVYVDAVQREVRDGRIRLEEYRGDAAYSYHAFWLNMPEMKRDYRRSEHLLHAGEMVSAAASLLKGAGYPSQGFYESWIQMLMNMDRNTLWGAGSGSPFYDSHHWNVWDRFHSVTRQAEAALRAGLTALTSEDKTIAFFNPLNWRRDDPVTVTLPPGLHLQDANCEARPGTDEAVCFLDQPAAGLVSVNVGERGVPPQNPEPFSAEISTDHYVARFDGESGAMISLRDRRTDKEYLGGPANVVRAESVEGVVKDPTNWMAPRPMRKLVDSTSRRRTSWQVFRGPLSVTLVARSGFAGGSRVERRVTFYHHYPRIDFETTVDLRARRLLVTADFPLAGTIVNRTRGIPFGFSSTDPRNPAPPNEYFLMADHRTYGFSAAIQPAVRWSDYSFEAGGVALLDRGLTGHELNGNTVTLALVNAQDDYRGLDNLFLTGQGVRTFEYAVWPHAGDWRDAAIPRRAWEFNTPAFSAEGRRAAKEQSFLTTSDNLMVESVRRVGTDLEVRIAEWAGRPGEAGITLRLPHRDARQTNLMGEHARPIVGDGGTYRFSVRPQQIVTLRFRLDTSVPTPAAIRDWAPLVPRFKRGPLEVNEPVRGYPEITRQPTAEDFGPVQAQSRN